MPTRLCLEPGCPHPATYRGRCADHARTNDRNTHTNKGIYNTAKWKHTRRRVLFEQPLCGTDGCDELSTDVHHRVDLADGGAPWARSNLEALCHACHSRLTRRGQQANIYQAPCRPAFLILCGKPGTGKTATRIHLAALTSSTAFGPDDYMGNWHAVRALLDRTNHAIIECCRIPRALRHKVEHRGATIIELTASADLRCRRLAERGDRPEAIEQLLAEDGLGLGYEDHIEPDIVLSTESGTPEETARTIVARLAAG